MVSKNDIYLLFTTSEHKYESYLIVKQQINVLEWPRPKPGHGRYRAKRQNKAERIKNKA